MCKKTCKTGLSGYLHDPWASLQIVLFSYLVRKVEFTVLLYLSPFNLLQFFYSSVVGVVNKNWSNFFATKIQHFVLHRLTVWIESSSSWFSFKKYPFPNIQKTRILLSTLKREGGSSHKKNIFKIDPSKNDNLEKKLPMVFKNVLKFYDGSVKYFGEHFFSFLKMLLALVIGLSLM